MSRSMFRVSLGVLGAAAAAASMGAMQVTPQDSAALIARAKAIHDRVITLDTHNDINANNFTAECNYTMRLTNQVNLPKMMEGGIDVSFMIVYVGQGAADAARATTAPTSRPSRSSTPFIGSPKRSRPTRSAWR